MGFPSDLPDKLLLWCDRHCCLCKKACDAFIEIHHIVPRGGDTEDNAIPVCFDCQGKIGHYNPGHPKGTKFKSGELKKRRDQIHDEFTRHLVPALWYNVNQDSPTFPNVGFFIRHLGDAPSVRVSAKLDLYLNGALANETQPGGARYGGELPWNLNPKESVDGNFWIHSPDCREATDIRIGVNITIHDCYERPHALLPVTYVYNRTCNKWWLDPIDPVESAARALADA